MTSGQAEVRPTPSNRNNNARTAGVSPVPDSPRPPSLNANAKALAERLRELDELPCRQIEKIIELKGIEFALETAAAAEAAHAGDGMRVRGGRRKRTLGGIFFRLVRDQLVPSEKRLIFAKPEKLIPDQLPGDPVDAYLQATSEDRRTSVEEDLDRATEILLGTKARDLPWSTLQRADVEKARDQLDAARLAELLKRLIRLAGTIHGLGQEWTDDRTASLTKAAGKWAHPPLAQEEHTADQIAAAEMAVAACEKAKTPKAKRDAAILRLQYYENLSPNTIATLELADYATETGRLQVAGAWRTVDERTHAAALAWLESRGEKPGRLFATSAGGGISPVAIGQLVKEHARRKTSGTPEEATTAEGVTQSAAT